MTRTLPIGFANTGFEGLPQTAGEGDRPFAARGTAMFHANLNKAAKAALLIAARNAVTC